MDDQLKKEFVEYFQELPKDVQERFLSLNLDSVLNEIEEAKPLQEVQKKIIRQHITLCLLGLANIEMFATKIKHSAEITRDRADTIAKAIEEKVFLPNVELIKSTYVKKGGRVRTMTGGVIHNEVPSPDPYKEPADLEGTGAPKQTPIPKKAASAVPQAPKKLENVEAEYKSEKQPDALDIFKKRLSSPVNSPVKEEMVGGEEKEKVANINPSTKEQIEKDPYKESIE